jgi:hypothetical protein
VTVGKHELEVWLPRLRLDDGTDKRPIRLPPIFYQPTARADASSNAWVPCGARASAWRSGRMGRNTTLIKLATHQDRTAKCLNGTR